MINFMFTKRPYYIYIFLLSAVVLAAYGQTDPGYWSIIISGVSFGTILNSWFFCNFQDTINSANSLRVHRLMMENFDLKQELLIAKMPHLAKSMDSDKLS